MYAGVGRELNFSAIMRDYRVLYLYNEIDTYHSMRLKIYADRKLEIVGDLNM